MSLIEQAAQRLEQLRKAGFDVPSDIAGNGQPELTSQSEAKRELSPPETTEARHASLASPSQRETVASRHVKINLELLAANGLICPEAPRTRIADEYRVIKRPLIENAMGKGASPIKDGNLIMVTSALPGEGKTFTAANLALSIAMELDNTVMLVDADVARPTLLSRFGLPPSRGLLDVLVDDSVSLSHVLLRTNVEKLTFLPSGTQHPRATELLASDAMVRLLEEMASRYSDRIIIFDSPPPVGDNRSTGIGIAHGAGDSGGQG